MRRNIIVLGLGLFILSAAVLVSAQPAGDSAAATAKVRIGTYDSRAIAVAYAGSTHNPVGEKMKEHEQAKAAGDAAKVKELEDWGKTFQRQLHFQGFGRVPVGDLLAPVKEGVAKVAEQQQLSAIVMACDFVADGVEQVDVTDALVALYAPSERTLDNVKKVREVEPVSLLELADMPAEQ